MKYCSSCGAEINDNAVVCTKCGCSVANTSQPSTLNVKYCPTCGAQLNSNAVVCTKCGCSVANTNRSSDSGAITAAKVLLIVGCVIQGWTIIALAWCLPVTILIFGKLNRGEPLGTGLKVGALFVNIISGILLLCSSDV